MPVQRRRSRSLQPPVAPRLLAKAMAAAAQAMFITDREGCILWVNDAFSRLSGYTSGEVIGQTPRFLQSGKQDSSFYRELWNTIQAGRVWCGEVVDRRKDGSLFTVEEVITPLRDNKGMVTHFLAVQHDITSGKQERDRDHYLAYHDMLTGLPNRTQFLALLDQAIANTKRTQSTVALLYLDLDNFKPINDSLGHHAGDQLLVAVAERLSGAIRKTDTVARLGGDEFAVLQTGFFDAAVVVALARKLIGTISEPFAIAGHEIRVSASIGIAFYPADGVEAEELLSNADKAMYRAKHQGRNAYCLVGSDVEAGGPTGKRSTCTSEY